MGVRTNPGQTTVTPIGSPVMSSSARNASEVATTACLEAPYEALKGVPASPAMEAVLMTWPRPGHEVRHESADAVQYSEQVGVHDSSPLVQVGLPQRFSFVGGDSRVVEDQVDSAEVFHDPLSQRAHRCRVGDVHDSGQEFAATSRCGEFVDD